MKIDGKYKQQSTENLLKQINSEDSITKRHHLISRYLFQREKQIEMVNLTVNIMETISNEEKAKQTYPYYEDMNDIELVQTNAKRIGLIAGCEWKDKQLIELLKSELATWRGNSAEAKYRREMLKELLEKIIKL